MTSPDSHPLLAGHTAESIVAWRRGAAIPAAGFINDVLRVAQALPAGRHVLNTCADRYRFAVGLAATLVAGKVSLLPSTITPEVVVHLREFAPDAICLRERPQAGSPAASEKGTGLPETDYPDCDAIDTTPVEMPMIPADQLVAWVFTSGSTGVPVPHRKTWGPLVRNVRAEGGVLGLRDGRRHTIVGTVPPQHMYGLESTVLVAMQNGAAFNAARPLYPADICSELEAVPRPRALVTTPFHLRTLLDAGIALPAIDLVLSATAPLSTNLALEAEARCGAPLLEIYGSTETGQIAHRRPANSLEWTLFPGVELQREGDVVHASGGHVEGTVPMGDVIEPTSSGRFVLHGRSADMINIAGKRSSLAYLDHQLRAVEGVQDGAFLLPEETPDGVARLVAVVVAPGLDAPTLLQALRERIEPAFLPRRVLFVEALPRNATGKLPTDALRALWSARVRPTL